MTPGVALEDVGCRMAVADLSFEAQTGYMSRASTTLRFFLARGLTTSRNLIDIIQKMIFIYVYIYRIIWNFSMTTS